MHAAAIGLRALAHQGRGGGTVLDLRGPALLIHALHHEAQMAAVRGIINIANKKVNVVINSVKNDLLKMRVVDMMGKEVLLETIGVNAGVNIKNLELKNGVYILLLMNSGGEKWSSKIVVQ